MPYVFLPFNDEIWLHKINGECLLPVVIAPGTRGAKHFLSTDQNLYVCLDQSNKRITVYRLLDNEPWLERIVSPVTLPKNCLADDILMHNQVVYIGGRSRSGECIWQRGLKDNTWGTVPLPSNFPRKKGKSVDLLFHDGNKLIAIDNIILPKWILTYDISDSENIVHLKTIELVQHTSYERVHSGADNEKYIALVSGGINYGTFYQYVSIMEKSSLKELLVLFTFEENMKSSNEIIKFKNTSINSNNQSLLLDLKNNRDVDCEITEHVFDHESVSSTLTGSSEALKLPVDFVYDVVFFDKCLLFATSSGLFSLDISHLDQVEQLECVGIGMKFKKIITRNLAKVCGFKSNPANNSSIFIQGFESSGALGFEMISTS